MAYTKKLKIPDGDILIHAGDWTRFGRESDATDFNDWLGTLPHKHKIVVNGNHEANASWKNKVETILSNAIFLKQRSIIVQDLCIFGTQFFWPTVEGENPYLEEIPKDVEILICHGPVAGHADDGQGCPTLLTKVKEIRPRLVVSGHIHSGHSVEKGKGLCKGITFVNASICRKGYEIGWDPVVLDL
eukprot:TRINITY_DN5525_c0_g1_i1.p1 TRINITY_DN5525_c0_g1~~TRINITY_DN5525_c0_g1_i1.p1  ORF type:complete len:187 (-),score=27.99 TRINITY_DN5525_c0_g1_i1:298-858(-)